MDNIDLSEKLTNILIDNGIFFKENSTGELIFEKCYNCGRSNKLYASKETGQFKCFRCEEKGNAIKLVGKLLHIPFKEAAQLLYGKGHGVEDVSIEAMKKEIEEQINSGSGGLILNLSGIRKKSVKNELELPEPIKLEDDYLLLDSRSNIDAYNYLLGRGYTADDIKKLRLYVLPYRSYSESMKMLEKKYKPSNFDNKTQEEKDDINNLIKKINLNQGRILFPLYIEGEIYGFVARDYTGKKQPKVLNSTGNFRSYYFWNFDLVKNSDEIIICEGTSSAVKAGIHRSIALLGKVATKGQLKLLKKTKATKIYFCLDIGTDKEQDQLFDNLNIFYFGQIYTIKLPPVFSMKKRFFSESIQKCMQDFSYTYLISEDTIHMVPEERVKLLAQYSSLVKRYALSTEDQDILFYIAKDAEYKDSGDYSPEEMEEFKLQAELYIKNE